MALYSNSSARLHNPKLFSQLHTPIRPDKFCHPALQMRVVNQENTTALHLGLGDPSRRIRTEVQNDTLTPFATLFH